MQQFWDAYKVPLTGGLTWAVLFVTTILARYKLSPGAWYTQALRIIFGAIVDNIQPSTFKQVAAQATEVKKEKKSRAKAIALSSIVFTVFLCTGCGGSLQKQLNAVLVAEHQAQTYEAVLNKMALDAVLLLPADQQAAALAKYNEAKTKLDDALVKKDTALQDAIIADSTAGANLGQLLSDVYAAILAVVDLVKVLTPANAEKADAIGLSMKSMQAKVQLVR